MYIALGLEIWLYIYNRWTYILGSKMRNVIQWCKRELSFRLQRLWPMKLPNSITLFSPKFWCHMVSTGRPSAASMSPAMRSKQFGSCVGWRVGFYRGDVPNGFTRQDETASIQTPVGKALGNSFGIGVSKHKNLLPCQTLPPYGNYNLGVCISEVGL